MLPIGELKNALISGTKECDTLWQENKDLQAQFVNDLSELQRFQNVIQQLEGQIQNGVVKKSEALSSAKQQMKFLQQKAARLYQNLTEKRQALLLKLNEGIQQIAFIQNDLISVKLLEWKQKQKLAQIGAPFDRKEEELDQIQNEFELLAEHNWQLRTLACWLLDLSQRGPQLPDNNAQQCANNLSPIIENLTKLLWMLVSQSFIVSQQPEPVLKTQHKFTAQVRLLIGDKLGIKQQLDNTSVTVKITAEDQAKQLHANKLHEKDIKNEVGSISNDFEKLQLNDKGHMSATFSNSKLTRIAPRKPASKGSTNDKQTATAAATDQKYALLFHITPFQLGNLGKFDVWTLSLPLMVTVHGSQDCDAQATILWQRAFGSVNWSPGSAGDIQVSWSQLSDVLQHKFLKFTGVQRPLSDKDLQYMAEKLYAQSLADYSQAPKISFHRFAKQNLRDDVSFSFWEWLFSVMQLIRQKLQVFWDEGWLIGFVSKQEASKALVSISQPTFLLRFSDTQTGAVSIGFVCFDEEQNCVVPFHLSPFVAKELDQLSLPQRIATCPSLQQIRFLYPDIDKEEVLRRFEAEERNKSPSPTDNGGYIGAEVIMVAKTGKPSVSSIHESVNLSPASMLTQHLNLESPVDQSLLQNMETTTDDSESCNSNPVGGVTLDDSFGSLEQLLGPNFASFLPSDSVLPHLDLSGLLQNIPTMDINMDMEHNSD